MTNKVELLNSVYVLPFLCVCPQLAAMLNTPDTLIKVVVVVVVVVQC